LPLCSRTSSIITRLVMIRMTESPMIIADVPLFWLTVCSLALP
jgi:hypothetical protein